MTKDERIIREAAKCWADHDYDKKAVEEIYEALADTEDTGGICSECGGTGEDLVVAGARALSKITCGKCNGTGHLPPKEQADEAMDLHGEIMNLRIKLGAQIAAINESTEPPILSLSDIAIMAYKRGHRDARHGAAELVCEWQAIKEVSNADPRT